MVIHYSGDTRQISTNPKARLVGDASMYKPRLDRERLRDPNEGVYYFTNELRPHSVKGAETAFIVRFYQLQTF